MNFNKGTFYFLFAAVVIGSMVIFFKVQRDFKMENPNLTDLATEPDLLMNTADRTLQDHKSLTAINFLDDAIKMMKLLEKDGDSISTNAIEIAIYDLEIVEKHIKAEDINDDLMYEAFADAMNSLAFASLRISEQFIREGKKEEARITIHHAMDHLQNSIKFARGQQKADDIRIASHLQKLIDQHLENDISEIDLVMAEIDSLIKAHVIK
ncbi:hypothetical protein [Ekhidna sp.]|uniref:hypothetical protein n=1 Tax=Ekhidna sp. TaxID=2608089 RepID=UPI0032ED238C